MTPEIRYVFEQHGVEAICNGVDQIQTVFLHRGDGESLVDIPFVLSRNEVRQRFGPPVGSGNAVRLPVLGDRGPWDRFVLPKGVLHIQYAVGRDGRDEIEMITLMRPEAVP